VVAVVAALAEATLYSHPCAIRAGGNGKWPSWNGKRSVRNSYDRVHTVPWGEWKMVKLKWWTIQTYLGCCVTPSNYGSYPGIHRRESVSRRAVGPNVLFLEARLEVTSPASAHCTSSTNNNCRVARLCLFKTRG
jgi:hypothetical protein